MSFAIKVQEGFSKVLAGDWRMINVANGFRSGFGNANTFYNLSESTEVLKNLAVGDNNWTRFWKTWIGSSWKIGKTTLKAHRLAPIQPLLANHMTALKCAAASWAGMNLLTLIHHSLCGPDSTIENTFFGTIWVQTPNALLITNIALTTLELQVNFTKAVVSFITMGISYFEFKGKELKQRDKFWNWVLPISMRAVVFYYGNNWQRTMIAVDAVTSTIKFVHEKK
ncbi:MAG TPA: hypothetical protein VMR37_06215 [Rhabdochlamydiaceae bacterium]|nr:hypothetical protein [Rhabdochlamydiaceae bacterium]